ncbi:MAG: iron-containing redox enzyme family protein, partial [Myxococcota bacterium]
YDAVFREIDRFSNQLQSNPAFDVAVTTTGLRHMWSRINDYLESSQVNALLICGLVVSIALIVFFQSILLGLIMAAVNAYAIVVVLGVMGWMDIYLDPYTILIASIALGILDDDTIHNVRRVLYEVRLGQPLAQAIHTAHETTGQAMFYTSTTMSLALLCYVFSTMASLAKFGILTAFTIVVGGIVDFFLVPSVLLGLHKLGLRVGRRSESGFGGTVSSEINQFEATELPVEHLPSSELPKGEEATVARKVAELSAFAQGHRFWQNRFFKACAAGHFSKTDFRRFFEQYFLYSSSFTRFLAAIMANCDKPYYISKLSENMAEESGEGDPEQRHSEIFRRFVENGLGGAPGGVDYHPATRDFVRSYLQSAKEMSSVAGSAFMALGTEGIVPRMYEIFISGLRAADIAEEELTFFKLHIACDDEHAEILAEMMASYAGEPGWETTCRDAIERALDLRCCFFEEMYDYLVAARMTPLLNKIQDRVSLVGPAPDMGRLVSRPGDQKNGHLYDNRVERLGIDFSVERQSLPAEVFDVRVLRIPAGARNERHKHPHESVFYVIEGRGSLSVNEAQKQLEKGDVALVPRWALHQTTNVGEGELVILAVTDFRLTEQVYVGNAVKATRYRGEEEALQDEHNSQSK